MAKAPRYTQKTDLTFDEQLEDLDGQEVREIERYFGQSISDLLSTNAVALSYGLVWAYRKQNGEPKLSIRAVHQETKLGQVLAWFAPSVEDEDEDTEAGKDAL